MKWLVLIMCISSAYIGMKSRWQVQKKPISLIMHFLDTWFLHCCLLDFVFSFTEMVVINNHPKEKYNVHQNFQVLPHIWGVLYSPKISCRMLIRCRKMSAGVQFVTVVYHSADRDCTVPTFNPRERQLQHCEKSQMLSVDDDCHEFRRPLCSNWFVSWNKNTVKSRHLYIFKKSFWTTLSFCLPIREVSVMLLSAFTCVIPWTLVEFVWKMKSLPTSWWFWRF